jgi:hypothetical protein
VTTLFNELVFIDRRVDPQQRVTLQLEAASIDDVLRSVAEAQSLGLSQLGVLRYLGPRYAAEALRTVALVSTEELAQLPRIERTKLERKQRLTWPRLSEPRVLVSLAAERCGWRILNSERIPHDLWSAGELPELTAAEQLTVLLMGFNLTFKPHPRERGLEILPLEKVAIERRYRLPDQFPDPTLLLQQELPLAVTRVEGRSILVDGRLEDHERLAELLSGRMTPRRAKLPSGETKRVYTLRVEEQPVGTVLRQLADQFRWTIEIDEASIRAAGRSLDVRVSFSVDQSSEEDLLKAVLRPAGLDYRREDGRLRIVPGTGLP